MILGTLNISTGREYQLTDNKGLYALHHHQLGNASVILRESIDKSSDFDTLPFWRIGTNLAVLEGYVRTTWSGQNQKTDMMW